MAPKGTDGLPASREPCSYASFAQAVRAAERDLAFCFGALMELKAVSPEAPPTLTRLRDFQPRLARCMQRVEQEIRRIAARERKIIAKKRELSDQWFRARLALLAKRRRALKSVLGIGYSLGDAFAWFFYQFEPRLLAEHESRPPQSHPPDRQGGATEIATLERLQGATEWLPIYHSTTSILRLGDFTLFDLRTWSVAAILEVKAGARTGDTVMAQWTLVRKADAFNWKSFARQLNRGAKRNSAPAPGSSVVPGLAQSTTARRRRQLEAIVAGVRQSSAVAQPSMSEALLSGVLYGKLDAFLRRVSRGGTACANLHGGLSVVAIREKARSLLGVLLSEPVIDIPETLSRQVASTLLKGSPYNFLHLGSLHYDESTTPRMRRGAMPLFWWPLNADSIRRILFHELVVTTIWNPAQLFTRLEQRGLSIDSGTSPRVLYVSARTGDQVRTFVDPGYSTRATRQLMSDDEIESIVVGYLQRVFPGEAGSARRVELHEFYPMLPLEAIERLRTKRAKRSAP